MADVIKIASYICKHYQKIYGCRIDEMKLHKLLYFTQRESIIQTGKPLFEDCFEAWKYGPVMVSIRQKYKNNTLNADLTEQELDLYKNIFITVFDTYAKKDSWSLSTITHGEYAWIEARKKITQEQQHVLIKTDDIKIDAERIKIRRFLYEKMKNSVCK